MRTKRQLSYTESISNDTKKLRNAVDYGTPITCLEDLPNEIFHEIFEYFESNALFRIFSNLNNRFQLLLDHPSVSLRVSHELDEVNTQEDTNTDILASNKHRILSLRLFNSLSIEANTSLLPFDSSFTRLKSLTLCGFNETQLISLLISLVSLPQLYSLSISSWYTSFESILNIYYLIFGLPALTYSSLSDEDGDFNIPLPMIEIGHISNITYLVMAHNCTLDGLIGLISHTPHLRRLTCESVEEPNVPLKWDNTIVILTLVHVSIRKCAVSFDDFEIFLTRVSPHLQILCANNNSDTSYLNAKRWEQLILRNLRDLYQFNFNFDECFDEDFQALDYHKNLSDFNSEFWTSREWIFRITVDADLWSSDSITYSIFPYKETLNDKSSEQVSISKCSESSILSQTNQLIITDLPGEHYGMFNTDYLADFLTLLPVTYLKIDIINISVSILIHLVNYLSHLKSLVITSFSMLEPNSLSKEESNMLRHISAKTTIKKVELKKVNDLAQIQFLSNLFLRMTFFEIHCTDELILESIVRWLIMKNSRRSSYLCRVCIQVPNTCAHAIDKIKRRLEFEHLHPNFIVKSFDKKLCLEFNPRHCCFLCDLLSDME